MKQISIVAAFALLTGCVPSKQWRVKPFYTGEGKVEERFVIPPDTASNRMYGLAFVEFKNNGESWESKQLEEALRAIDDADRRSNHRALVITFIHGWKNNARQENNNVLDFRRQLNRIAAEACNGDAVHCGVVGIYLAWSGDVIGRDWNTLRTLTYFNRRDTAANVAEHPTHSATSDTCEAPICNALFTIMKHVKHGLDRATNHSVVVGHSFGGLILEYAIAKRMKQVGDELRSELGKTSTTDALRLKTLNDFADLVVLINQAAPAAHAVTLLTEFREELQRVNLLRPPMKPGCPHEDTSQECKSLTRPLILSISSESDLATRTVLPIAETISHGPRTLAPGVEEKLPKGLDVKKVFTTAAAHTPQLYSHQLLECKNGDCNPCLKSDKFYIPIALTLPPFAPGNDTHADKPMKYCVVRDYKAWNRTPYWIFHIPTPVVPDHGGIFTDRFTDFLTAFLPPLDAFRISAPTPPPTQKLYRKDVAQALLPAAPRLISAPVVFP